MAVWLLRLLAWQRPSFLSFRPRFLKKIVWKSYSDLKNAPLLDCLAARQSRIWNRMGYWSRCIGSKREWDTWAVWSRWKYPNPTHPQCHSFLHFLHNSRPQSTPCEFHTPETSHSSYRASCTSLASSCAHISSCPRRGPHLRHLLPKCRQPPCSLVFLLTSFCLRSGVDSPPFWPHLWALWSCRDFGGVLLPTF